MLEYFMTLINIRFVFALKPYKQDYRATSDMSLSHGCAFRNFSHHSIPCRIESMTSWGLLFTHSLHPPISRQDHSEVFSQILTLFELIFFFPSWATSRLGSSYSCPSTTSRGVTLFGVS
jgi:hypothetical protein